MGVEIGTRVRINTRPACLGEFVVHGIKPLASGLHGTVVGIEDVVGELPDHHVRVRFDSPGEYWHTHGWFTVEELEVVEN